METIKTAFVVVLLLAVLYGVYVVLTKPEPTPPPSMVWEEGLAAPPNIQYGPGASNDSQPAPIVPALATQVAPPPLDAPTPAVPVVPKSRPPVGGPDSSVYEIARVDTLGGSSHVGDGKSAGAVTPPPKTLVPMQPNPQNDMAKGVDPVSEYEVLSNTEPVVPAEPPAAPLESLTGDSQAKAAGQPENSSGGTFENAWISALAQLDKGQLSEALLTLSLFYNDASLTIEERTRLVDLLDPLAGRVIYSSEHTLEPPYTVQPSETLQDIAQRVQVPVTLLQNINGIQSPDSLTPGTQLKIVRGPFRSEINLDKSELTLFLGKRYAGRFSISVGNDPAPQPGDYDVQGKQPGREYFAPNSLRVPPLASDNPYGQWWLGLGGDVCIHGSPEAMPSHGGLGCISLRTADAADIYGILSTGSKVTVR